MMINVFYMFLSSINNFGRGLLSVLVSFACSAFFIYWTGFYYFVLSLGWTAFIMVSLSLWLAMAVFYKFSYFKNNSSLIMNTVEFDKAELFNKFLKGYLDTFAWLLTPTAMLFMKLYMVLNTYDFFIASAHCAR